MGDQGTLFGEVGESVLFFDGGSRGNPGPAAWGYTIADPSGVTVAAMGQAIGTATNNEAEYGGLIAGLARARELGLTHLTVHGDSKLVIEQMKGAWRVKAPGLQPLHEQARRHARQFDLIRFEHVRRAGNAEADRLLNAALDEASRAG